MIRRFAIASVSLLALATPAFAQSAPAETDDAALEGDVIVVEARRRDESAQDVPLVVNAVTAETISKLNLRDFKDIQTVVPGLSMNSNGNGIGTTSSVRGVNFDVNASGNNGTIEYYLIDAPLTSGSLFNSMYDIGQVEVLRGPQGTLRGRASPSGSITIAHRKPVMDEAGGYMTGTANTIGGWNFNGALNVPIIENVFAVRVSGLVDESESNRVHSINSPLKPYAKTQSGRVFAKLDPLDNVSLEGVYQRIEMQSRQFDQVACFNQYLPSAPACAVDIKPKDRLAIEANPNSARAQYDIFTWKASVGFAGQRLIYVGSDVHQQVNSFDAQDNANAYPSLNLGQFNSNDMRGSSHEVRLQNDSRLFDMVDYVAGYFRTKLDSPTYLITERLQPVGGVVSMIPSMTLRDTLAKEESFYGNLSIHLGNTEISGGARHIKSRQQSSLGVVTPVSGSIAVPPPYATDVSDQVLAGKVTNLSFGDVDREFKKTLFSASVKHNFTRDLMVYANFGTSFRPGNNVVRSTINANASALENGFLVLPSETSKSYEIGLKSSFLNDTLKVNVAAFQQDFKNYPFRSPSGVYYLQYATTTSAPQVASFNFVAPVPVRVRGFEAEIDWRPSDRFSLNANVAYAMGKIRNGQVACLDLNGDGVPDTVATAPSASDLLAAVGADNLSTCGVNSRSMTASPWNANVQAEYNVPVNGAMEAFARGIVSYSGSSLNDPANAYDDYGAYARANLFAGVRDADGAWEVSLYGKNIFRDRTVLATSNGPAFTSVTAGPTISSPYIGLGTASVPGMVAPREFGISARIAFGSR